MTKKDGDKLRAMRKELGDMALSYDADSNTSRFLWEMKSRLGMFLAGYEREAMAGLLNDKALSASAKAGVLGAVAASERRERTA